MNNEKIILLRFTVTKPSFSNIALLVDLNSVQILGDDLNTVKFSDIIMFMSVAKVVRNSYHHGNLKSALISSAIKLIRKNGPYNLSLREVSSELGVSPSAAYHYFPDKESLVHGIGEYLFTELAVLTEKSLEKFPGKSARATKLRFREIGRAYFNWARKEPNLFRLMFGGFCSIDREKSHIDDASFKILEKTLDELVACCVMPSNLRPFGEIMAWSSVHGAVNLIIEGHLPESSFEELLDGLELALGVKHERS